MQPFVLCLRRTSVDRDICAHTSLRYFRLDTPFVIHNGLIGLETREQHIGGMNYIFYQLRVTLLPPICMFFALPDPANDAIGYKNVVLMQPLRLFLI